MVRGVCVDKFMEKLDVDKILDAIKCEINCGQFLNPTTDLQRIHNSATERALNIINNYLDGIGLFQMTGKAPKINRSETKVGG